MSPGRGWKKVFASTEAGSSDGPAYLGAAIGSDPLGLAFFFFSPR